MVRNKHLVLTVPIYNKKVLVIQYNNIKYVNKILDTYEVPLVLDDSYLGVCTYVDTENTKDSKRLFVLAIKNLKDATVLVHECFHLTQDILEYVGIPYKKGGANEAYSYLQEYLVKEIKTKLKL